MEIYLITSKLFQSKRSPSSQISNCVITFDKNALLYICYVLMTATLFGKHERMTFHKQPESLGFSFTCFVTTPSQPLSTHTLLRTLTIYMFWHLELLVFSASLRHSSLVCINTFISFVTKG